MKIIFGFFTFFIVVFFSFMGCTLPYSDKTQSYDDTIISFYTNEDSNTIAIIGTKYHYIFTSQPTHVSSMFHAQKLLHYGPGNFNIDFTKEANERIAANMYFSFDDATLNEEQKVWLLSHNFYKLERKDNQKTTYEGSIYFEGKRYRSSSEISTKITLLKNPMAVKVIESDTSPTTTTSTPLIFQDNLLELNNQILYYLF